MAQEQDYLAKKQYVDENYQPKLIPGTGISINPITNEITSSGGGSLVTYAGNPNISQGDSLGVLTINGTPNVIRSPGLIPGTNVTITTDIATGAKTIAATGGTTVTPNPQGAPSGVLTSIGIGNAIYSLQGGAYYGTTDPDSSLGIDGDIYIKYTSGTPDTINAMFVKINDEWIEAELGGGGGTDVEANPTGAATDTLNKIRIDQTIYDIEGGSSSGYIEKELIYTVEQGGRWETFTNPDSDNPLLIENVYKGAIKTFIFNPNDLPARDGGVDNYVTIGQTLTGININLGQTNSGETIYISLQNSFDSSVQSTKVYKILSYNNIEGAVELYSSNQREDTITLSKSFRDYEYINLLAYHPTGPGYWVNTFYKTSELQNGQNIGIYDDSTYMWYNITNDTTLARNNTGSNGYYIAKIYGFNIGGGGGSGGTTVVANPEEEPTDALETIQIDDTVYNIPGGLEPIEIQWSVYRTLPLADRLDPTKQYFVRNIPGGGDGTIIDDLFENDGTTNPTTITFDNPITDYDIISFQVETTNHDAIFTMDYIVDNLTIGDYIGAGSYTGIFVWYTYTDVDELTFLSQSAAGHYLSRIRGIKFGLGGGGGDVADVRINGSTILDLQKVANIPILTGATDQTNGALGLAPAPLIADKNKVLGGSGTYVAKNNAIMSEAEPLAAEGNDSDLFYKMQPKIEHLYEYIRFKITATKGEGTVQFSEISFKNANDQYFNWTGSTAATNISTFGGEGVNNVIDNQHTSGKMCGGFSNPTLVTITLPTGSPINLDEYPIWEWYTANDAGGRDPYSFELLVSHDGETWETLDSQTEWSGTSNRNALAYSNNLNLVSNPPEILKKFVKFEGEWVEDAIGGGTEIEANPSETPTDTLETIKIGETIYEIESGGGGSSFVKLAEYTDSGVGYAAGSTITLSQDITNFDILLFSIVWQNGTDGFPSGTVVVDDFINKYPARVYADYSGAGYVDVLYLSNTSISVLRTGGEYVHAVYGVKFGSGGGGGGQYTETELFVNTTPTTIPPASITLDDDFTNYDILYFDIIRAADNKAYHIGKELLVSTLAVGDSFQFLIYNGEYFSFTITDNTTFTRLNYGGDYLYKIIGIKIEGSGDEGSSGINYSTEEQIIGTWIDGNTLYQKSIQYPQISGLGSGWNSTGLDVGTNLNLDKLISIELHGVLGENLGYESTVTPSFTDCGANKSNLRFWLPTTYALIPDYITIRYTKNIV